MTNGLRSNTWVTVDLRILRENVRAVRAGPAAGSDIIFVVKSNAYGHGLEPVARAARETGIRWFAVANVSEACRARRALPDARILIVGAADAADVPEILRCGAVALVVDEDHARRLAAAAERSGAVLRCHAKIDTGMGRLGFAWPHAARALCALAGVPGLRIEGICSHFASAGEGPEGFAGLQLRRFEDVTAACAARGLQLAFRHISNSAGLICLGDCGLSASRTGILLYGYGPGSVRGRAAVSPCGQPGTRPFLQWRTRVVQTRRVPAGYPVGYDSTHVTDRETVLGVLEAGYADGYPRRLSNRGRVLVEGRRCPVVGRVTMNLTAVDLGSSSRAAAGSEAVLLGSDGGESIWADELAEWADTICYEILTGIRTADRRIIG